MAYPTPPPTSKKTNRFMEPTNKLTYYEDVYGNRNEDEDLKGNADACEDDTESEDDGGQPKESASNGGFFKKHANQIRHRRFVQPGFNRFGEIKRRHGQNIFNHSHLGGKGSTVTETNQQYKIAPSINQKQSVTVSKSKKLTPKRHGLFSSSFTRMEGTNTAGEAMDDILRAGSLGDYDEFPVLDEDGADDDDMFSAPISSSYIDPALLVEDQHRATVKKAKSRADSVNSQQEAGAQEPSNPDIEDNSTNAGERMRAGKPGLEVTATKATHRASKRIAGNNKVQKPTTSMSSRFSTRNLEKVKNANVATRPVRTKAAELENNKKKKMTARAATLYKKAKKKGVAAMVQSGHEQRSVRLRNWKGEVIKEGDGYVEVLTDEEDDEGYVLY